MGGRRLRKAARPSTPPVGGGGLLWTPKTSNFPRKTACLGITVRTFWSIFLLSCALFGPFLLPHTHLLVHTMLTKAPAPAAAHTPKRWCAGHFLALTD